MAGEFAFSISLTFASSTSAFAGPGPAHRSAPGAGRGACSRCAGLCHLDPGRSSSSPAPPLALGRAARARPGCGGWLARCPVAGLLAAFWVLPFFWRRAYVNDMGWEKLAAASRALAARASVLRHLRALSIAAGCSLSLAGRRCGDLRVVDRSRRRRARRRLRRIGARLRRLAAPGPALARPAAAVLVPVRLPAGGVRGRGRLDPGRSPPLVGRRRRDGPRVAVGRSSLAAPAGFAVVVMVVLADRPAAAAPCRLAAVGGPPSSAADGAGRRRPRPRACDDRPTRNVVPGWAQWNFTGLRAQGRHRDERRLARVPRHRPDDGALGAEHGCGRAMWEYEQRRLERLRHADGADAAAVLDRRVHRLHGGPLLRVAPPRCRTTSSCSPSCRRAGRRPSATCRTRRSTSTSASQHMQMIGVKYYLAFTRDGGAGRRANPDLTEVATAGPWHVYEVADAPLVEGLDYEPVVVDGNSATARRVARAGRRVVPGPDAPRRPLAARRPGRVAAGPVPTRAGRPTATRGPDADDRPSSTAARLPRGAAAGRGQRHREGRRQHLLRRRPSRRAGRWSRSSYFPNWEVKGAEGPYRVTPNLMVVIPTTARSPDLRAQRRSRPRLRLLTARRRRRRALAGCRRSRCRRRRDRLERRRRPSPWPTPSPDEPAGDGDGPPPTGTARSAMAGHATVVERRSPIPTTCDRADRRRPDPGSATGHRGRRSTADASTRRRLPRSARRGRRRAARPAPTGDRSS